MEFLIENDIIGMGFCNPSKPMFYTKCGYVIMPNAYNNFECFDKVGQLVPSNYAEGDVVIWDSMKQIYAIWDKNNDTKFRISKPHW